LKYNPETMQTVYEAAGGRDGLLRLASAWHTRVLEDEVVSHAFSDGFHPQHTERLAAYWAEALGGTTTYSDPSLRPVLAERQDPLQVDNAIVGLLEEGWTNGQTSSA
jgi:truncated hemoglobin YjbI